MNVQELQSRVDQLIAPMLAKGLVSPGAQIQFNANSGGGISLSWQWRERKPTEPFDEKNFASKWFWAGARDDGREPWDGTLIDAMRHIVAMPEKADRQRDEFLKLLAQATEYGRKVGIDEEFVNPLAMLAKKLSENALEHHPESGERIALNISEKAQANLDNPVELMPRAKLVDDDIPF